MKKQWIAIILTLTASALAFAGNDPWTSKPFQQWDDKDITKVLQMSPWSHTVPVEMTWKALSTEDLEMTRSMDAEARVHSGPSASGAGSGGSFPSTEHDQSAYTRGPEVSFSIYWSSSKTIREALARRNEMHGGADAQAAQAYANAPQEEYQVLVQGTDMSPFDRVNEKGYASMAWLQLKGSKQKIMPTHVQYTHDAKIQAAVNGAIFFFAKKNPDGSPTIPPTVKSMDFFCKVGASTIHAAFEPQKMKNMSGLDL